MKRRMLLGAAAAASLSGCVGQIEHFVGGDEPDCPDGYEQFDFEPVAHAEDAVLGGPECPRGSPSHPVYGDTLPDFSVHDPFANEVVSSADLTAGSPLVLTFIFTNCPDRCPELMGILQIIQNDAVSEGWDDEITLAAMTWDPARDDVEALRDYGEAHGINVDHEQFRFLRPETNEEAIEVVDQTLGVPAQHGDDHDHNGASHVHYYMIFIVNSKGVVERSYPGPMLFHRSPDDISQAVRTVVTNDA